MGHTWLVTGANGFLGANAIRVLEQKSDTRVLGTSRRNFDLKDRVSMRNFFITHSPQFVLNTAAMAVHSECESDPTAAHAINAEAVKTLAQECSVIGATLIHISTDAVFDGHRGDYTELDPTSPNTEYGRSKLLGEEYALAYNPALIIRTNFFGWSPNGQRSILEFFTKNLAAGKKVNGFTDTITTSLYAGDLVERIFALQRSQGIIHLTSSDAISKYQFGCLVAEAFNFDPALVTAIDSPGGPKNISLNTDKASGLLGSPLPTQQEGITRAFAEREIIGFPGQQ